MDSMLSAFNSMRGIEKPDLFYATELNSDQLREIELAESNGLTNVAEDLRKHPEYDVALMNTIINRCEQGNQSVELCEFCDIWGPDMNGHIGCYNILEEYWNWEDIVPGELMNSYSKSLKDKGIKYCVFKAAEEVLGVRNRTSRIGLTDNILNHRGKLFSVMSEGDTEAHNILEKIQYMTSQFNKNKSSDFELFPASLGSHLMEGTMRILRLDDMNIRGKQLVYALEYADGSYETLIQMISHDDENMIKYINKRMYEDVKNGELTVPRAVISGASFDDYAYNDILFLTMMDRMEIEGYGDIKSMTRDWVHSEIVNDVSKSDAIKIMEANGFHIVHRNVPIGARFEEIIFHNKSTGAIAYCCATEDDCCYGGFTINLAHYNRVDGFDFSVQTNRSDNGDWFKTEITYQNNLISNYNKYKELNPIQDTTVLGYGMEGIPIPSTICTNKFVVHKDWKHNELIGLMYNNLYQPTWFINCIYVNDTYKKLADEDKWLYKPFMNNYWYNVLESSYFYNNVFENTVILGAVLKVLQVPKNQIDLIYDEIHKQCELYDSRNVANGRNICPTYVGLIEGNRDSLYGLGDMVDYVIDEFDLDKLGLPKWEM